MEKEEFEFKPLTEGLGFHRKAEQIKADQPMGRLASEHVGRTLPVPAATPRVEAKKTNVYENISKLMESMPASVDFAETSTPKVEPKLDSKFDPKLDSVVGPLLTSTAATTAATPAATQPKVFQPLTGPGLGSKKSSELPAPGTPAVKTPEKKKSRISEVLTPTAKKAGVPAAAIPAPEITIRKERKVELNIPAFLIDSMVVAGVSILCLVCILILTNVNLVGLLSHARTEGSTRLDMFLLLLFVMQFYMLASRSFFGATLGEWAFDQQLGTDEQVKRGIYPYQVLLRSLVVTVTGLILIPMLSFITQYDILQKISGLKIRSTLKTP